MIERLKDSTTLFSTLRNKNLIPQFFIKLPFEKIKAGILGAKYELSIVLIGNARSKNLNNRYRHKNYATDVLSFEISENSGEVFITPSVARVKAKKFGKTFEEYLLFLVIHACFHLKGLEHGVKMEQHELSHYNRYRRRYL